MYSNFYNEKNDFFSIIAASLLFHLLIAVALLVVILLKPPRENPPPIPFFEMVNVAPPPPAQRQAPDPVPEPVREPIPEPVPVVETPAPVPVSKPELKPEPKPVQKPVPVPKPAAPAPAEPAAPSMDMPMDLPSDIKSKDMDMPSVKFLGDVIMDSQMLEYRKRLYMLLRQNFNPPAGTEISKGTKSLVQFQIARNGEISEVVLRSSSGNSVWDRSAMRAPQITKPPPFPPSYTAENLVVIVDFNEK
ncbi:MAG: TonB family protein [Candidatus Fibromonas sp.]|jgi:protein TonB|nr:TonB family protein [Candidatus Fibromonas sp.]